MIPLLVAAVVVALAVALVRERQRSAAYRAERDASIQQLLDAGNERMGLTLRCRAAEEEANHVALRVAQLDRESRQLRTDLTAAQSRLVVLRSAEDDLARAGRERDELAAVLDQIKQAMGNHR